MPVSLITAEEEDYLPEDDDAAAFVMKERICRDEMNRILDRYNQNDDYSEVWIEYIVQVRAAAIAYGIDDALLKSPIILNGDSFRIFYEGAVITASTLARQARRNKTENTVALNSGEKARLERRLAELRSAIESSDLSVKLKSNLNKRLDGFSEELKKENSNISRIIIASTLVFTALGGSTLAVLSGVEKAEDVIIKLPETLEAILKITGRAKIEDVERQPEQKALPTPQKALPKLNAIAVAEGYGPRESFSTDLDDEIPF